MSFITKILAKLIGPKFLVKHLTTLLGVASGILTGFFARNHIEIDPVTLEQFFSSSKEIIIAVALYLLGLVIDMKPETPTVVKE